MADKPHFWKEGGLWHCGVRGIISWSGLTPLDAARARWDWLHAKDEERP